jgi:exopolysaccharide production protein ExoZ
MLVAMLVLAITDTAWGDFGIFYISHQLLYFVLGALVALADRHWLPGVRFSARFCYGFMLLHVLTSLAPDAIGVEQPFAWPAFHVLSAIFAPMTVFVFVRQAPLKATRLTALSVFLGDASYCTYLFHGFGIAWLKTLGGLLGVGSYAPAFALALGGVVAGNLAGTFFYWFVERPLRRVNWRALVHLQPRHA